MNIKKVAAVAAGVAMSLAVAVPAFAHGVRVENEDTNVRTYNFTVSNTGANFTGHFSPWGSFVTTGNALAGSEIRTSANYTEVGCGCFGRVNVENEDTNVSTLNVTAANTGFNFTGHGFVHTGNAGAGSVVLTDVNSTVVGGFFE